MIDGHLRTIIVLDADAALAAEALAPEAGDVDVGLRDAGVGDEQPQAEDGLGEDVEDGVGDDLAVDTDGAGAVSKAPDTGAVSMLSRWVQIDGKIDWGLTSGRRSTG